MTIYPRARSSRMGEPPSYRSLPCPPGPRGVNAAAELRGQGSQPCEIRTESKISSPAAAYPRPAPVTAERSCSAASYRYAAAKPRAPRRRGHGRPTTPAGSRRRLWPLVCQQVLLGENKSFWALSDLSHSEKSDF